MRVWSSGSSGRTSPTTTHVASRRSGGFLGRLWAKDAARTRPWGEDLVEQSLSTLSYSSQWDDVGRDELVFLLPALHRETCAAHPSGVSTVFGDALAEWTERAAHSSDPAAARHVLAILGTLHRLSVGHAGNRMPTTAEAMTSAIYARVNSAYADARLDHLHEPLMVAAWLGHLVAGRDALLPPVIAEPLAWLITGGSAATSRHPDAAGTVIVRHAAAAGGTTRLARLAAKVCRTGRPRLVRSTAYSDPFILERRPDGRAAWARRAQMRLLAGNFRTGD